MMPLSQMTEVQLLSIVKNNQIAINDCNKRIAEANEELNRRVTAYEKQKANGAEKPKKEVAPEAGAI
jgi:hypothetical protein